LPNLLADRPVVKEFIQDDVTPEALGGEILQLIDDPSHAQELTAVFAQIHDELRQDASRIAADAVFEVAGRS
jgi:lipid-A-disaccharide synthase